MGPQTVSSRRTRWMGRGSDPPPRPLRDPRCCVVLGIHHGIAEAFYVLGGEYIILLNDQEFRCPTGSFIDIPAEVTHGFRVGDVKSCKLNLYLPASMVGYFDELRTAIRTGEADPLVLDGIATRYAVEVVGPVPEGYL
jgi:hypothetical protein